LRHIKRAFGTRHTEDFQRYTWGLVLAIDLGLQVDKLELLTHVYCRKLHPRFIKSEYEKILTLHTTFRKIKDKNSVSIGFYMHLKKYKLYLLFAAIRNDRNGMNFRHHGRFTNTNYCTVHQQSQKRILKSS